MNPDHEELDMGLLNRHLPTLLFVLILALGTTGAFALGAHDDDLPDEAEFGQTVAEEAQAENGDVSDTAQDNDGAEVSTFAEEIEVEGCERGLTIAEFASGRDLPDEAHDGCAEDDNGDVETLENGDDASGFGQDTAENAQELEEGGGEDFGRDTADEARGDAGGQPEDAGSQQHDARERGGDARGNAGR